MSMEWYRAYHGMPYDTKLRVIARRSGQPMAIVVAIWVCMLDAASQHDPRGFVVVDPEEVAVVQDLDMKVVEAVINAFKEKGMIDGNNHLAAWDKRQHTTATERSRKHRDNMQHDATPCNTMQRDATACNTRKRKKRTDTDTDTDSDSEADKESDKKKKRGREEKKESEREKQIHEQMLEIWNTEVQDKLTKGHKAALTAKRKEQLTSRWIADFQEDIRAWQYYCEVIAASDFCMGRIAGKDWTIDINWATQSSDHVAKILEGGFSGGKHPTPPPICHDPVLQTAWDNVLGRFAKKYGKPTCNSWLSGTEISHVNDVFVIIITPNRFIHDWITARYLADLNLWWSEHSYQSRRITGIQLKIKEQPK